MKLQTQFTVPHKILRDIDYVKKMEVLEETFKKECIDYQTQEDCLAYCN
jgi:predicted metallo-beta-lactamase superfamily hydrolase